MRKLKMDELNRVDISNFKAQSKYPVVLLLDNVRSLHNVGSVFRTADAFAAEEIILCGITGQPPHREIEKTALGATQSMKWSYFPHITDAIERLKKDSYHIIAIEQAAGSIILNDFKPERNQKYALILGNEVNGVSDDAMQIIDTCIEIPQFGTKHSFNVAVSAGIVLWDIFSKAGR
ncbi:MAG TPA: RNA methyltransferase [Sphingobacteriaceae bacterium]|nr:RNA methyltransferase [Sphingobacteriaceae bacterium]